MNPTQIAMVKGILVLSVLFFSDCCNLIYTERNGNKHQLLLKTPIGLQDNCQRYKVAQNKRVILMLL